MAVILAIESSCDDTSAAVIVNGKIRSNRVAGQAVHERYGGVVPELASRAHHENIIPVVQTALDDAAVKLSEIDAVAFTQGPGLMGALLVGTSFAKALALALNVPLIGVNHMHAHILAHFIDSPQPQFPFICLTVSGGHIQLVLMHDYFKWEIIGQTIDDAAGEAFDKSAKLLGLAYPGGPLIDVLAQQGDASKFRFPEPKVADFDFSFSGLKTSILYFLRDEVAKNPNFIEENKIDLCAGIQHSIVHILLKKLKAAVKAYDIKRIAIAGGVSANSGLRTSLQNWALKDNLELFIPDFQYCTDNAGMIAMAAHFKYEAGRFSHQDVVPDPRLALTSDQ